MLLKQKYATRLMLLLIVTVCGIIGCTKENLPVKPVPSDFSASIKNGGNFSAAGGKDTIVIHAGTDGWWATIPSASSSWCSVTQTYGSGDFLLPVTLKANTTGASRQVIVTMNPSYNKPPVSITLTQSN